MSNIVIIDVPIKRLDARTFDSLLRHIVFGMREQKIPASEIHVAFNQLEFIDPYCMCSLWVIASKLMTRVPKLSLIVPNFHVQTYLGRIGIVRAIEKLGASVVTKQSIPYHRDSAVLLEATEIGQSEKSILRIVGKVEGLLSNQLNYPSREIANFCGALSEVCHNVRDLPPKS